MRKQNQTQGHCTGLTSAGLTSTGLISTGLTSPGLTSTGLTSTGLTSTGLTSTPLLVPNTGRKCRFYWPAQAKPHTRGVVPNTVPHIYGLRICGPHIYSAADPKHRSEPAQAKPHTRGVVPNTLPHIYGPHIFGPHIYGPHIYSAAGPKPRSEVWFLLACTNKTTHKRSGP